MVPEENEVVFNLTTITQQWQRVEVIKENCGRIGMLIIFIYTEITCAYSFSIMHFTTSTFGLRVNIELLDVYCMTIFFRYFKGFYYKVIFFVFKKGCKLWFFLHFSNYDVETCGCPPTKWPSTLKNLAINISQKKVDRVVLRNFCETFSWVQTECSDVPVLSSLPKILRIKLFYWLHVFFMRFKKNILEFEQKKIARFLNVFPKTWLSIKKYKVILIVITFEEEHFLIYNKW